MPKEVPLPLGTPNPVQADATKLFQDGKRFVLMVGGRQVGKSHYASIFAIVEIARNATEQRLGAIVSPTYRSSRVMVRKVKEQLQKVPGLWDRVKFREQPLPEMTFPNGFILEFHSASDPESLRGPTFSFVVFDEAALISHEAFRIVLPTLLASGGRFLATTTPKSRTNWVYKSLYKPSVPPGEDEHDPDLYSESYGTAKGSTWENVENLSEEAVLELERQYGKGSNFANQEISGEFISHEGLVYAWSEEHDYLPPHKMPQPHECSMVIGVLDFGWHPDPTAAYVMGYKDGAWYVWDGLYETKLGTNELATQLEVFQATFNPQYWVADSARPDAIAALRERGIPVIPVKKPYISERIKEMAKFADNHALKVSTRCPDVATELLTYQYPPEEKLEKQAHPNPIDKFNHACLVGETKVLTSEGEVAIKDVLPGTRVLTRQGYREVELSVRTQRQAKIYELTLSNGTRVRGTSDHPFFVMEKQKFVFMGELNTGDTLIHHTGTSKSTQGPKTVLVRVQHVRELEIQQDVYNLKVHEVSEYFANGVLVSNCDAIGYGIWNTRHLWANKVNEPDTEEDDEDDPYESHARRNNRKAGGYAGSYGR